MQLLSYDPRGTGIHPAKLTNLLPRLEYARTEMLETDQKLFTSGGSVPPEKKPLDAGFIHMPERLLTQYEQDGEKSELGRIQATVERLREQVNRVVVLGIGGSYMGARAMLEACCRPYYNELSREDRNGCPRIYFEGNNVDNDASQGLLDLLGRGRPAVGEADRWAIVVISKSGGTLETAVAFRQFLAALKSSLGDDSRRLAELVVPVTGLPAESEPPEKWSKLYRLAQAIGCPEIFPVPGGVGGRFSVLSAVGLLPAALMGLDIFALLRGAAAMNEHFRAMPIGENAVLDYVAVCHEMEEKQGVDIRALSVWSKSLEAAGLWYDQLLAESLGKQEKGALPLTVVNTRDLHSRAQQHQEGKRDKLFTNLIVDRWQREPLAVGTIGWDEDHLDAIADKTLPEVMRAAVTATNAAYHDDRRPTADIHLPRVDEALLGQFFQMMMLATVLEGRLIGINPYGQPGVQKYKKYLGEILGLG